MAARSRKSTPLKVALAGAGMISWFHLTAWRNLSERARMAMITSGLLADASGRRPSLERQPFMQHEEELMIAEVLIHHLDVMRFLCGQLTVIDARAARTVSDVRGETLAMIFLETASG